MPKSFKLAFGTTEEAYLTLSDEIEDNHVNIKRPTMIFHFCTINYLRKEPDKFSFLAKNILLLRVFRQISQSNLLSALKNEQNDIFNV